jgi:hypothetical protein
MSKKHELRVYDYVNRPYASVREVLRLDPLAIFQRATTTAAARANALGAELHVPLGPIELAADITIRVVSTDRAPSPFGKEATILALEWKSAKRAALFPTMAATLTAYALTSTETQLELCGTYDPPMGLVGDAIDAIGMHRIAEASVLRWVQDVAAFLRAELVDDSAPSPFESRHRTGSGY